MTKKITILIPCFNEAQTIGKVIDDFRSECPEAEIVVFDNNSSDQTAAIAKKRGVMVVAERRQGKGFVLRSAFDLLDADVYVMVDGDDTYPAASIPKLIQPVAEGRADMVVGTRLEQANAKSLRLLHQFGNHFFLKLINLLFRTSLNDILSGYRAMSRSFVEEVPLLSSGYEVETELTLQALEKKMIVLETPIHYRERPEGSVSKLRSFRDGWKITKTIASLLRDYRPMTFFSLIAAFFFVLGLGFGIIVIRDYLENGLVERTPSAILASLLLILAAMSLISGLIVGTINRRFKELHILMRREMRRAKRDDPGRGPSSNAA